MSYLRPAVPSAAAQRLFDADVADRGHVMNLTRVWAHVPELKVGLFGLIDTAAKAASLTVRQRAVLISACASTLGDSYCSLAWGTKLAVTVDPSVVAEVLGGDDGGLPPEERALAGWARRVADDPNGVTPEDVQALRDAGFDDEQIFALTAFVAFRLALATVNDALGATPDPEVSAAAPDPVRQAVTYGRPVDAGPSAEQG